MKTIFIALFEGVEAKNLLRSRVVAEVLRQADVRVVLLMKSEARVAYYKKEFNDPRLIYEVVPYERTLGRGFDRVFAILKFILLRTKTTTLRRNMAREIGGLTLSYYAAITANFIFAWPFFRYIVRWLDFALVRDTRYRALFDAYQPDLVFLAHLFEEPEIHFLREAKHRGISTLGLVNSWDKVTARAIMRLLPDRVLVFNDIVQEEMIRYNDMPRERITVVGIPQYDAYFLHPKPYIDRAAFCNKIGIDPAHKLIVYAPMGRTFSNTDWDVCDLLHELRDSGVFGVNVSILVRFQPNDFIQEDELKKRPQVKYDYPGRRFSTERGVDWDMNDEEIAHLHDTLFYADVVVCWAGSFGVDAAVFDTPVINPDLPLRTNEPRLHSPREHYKFEHYKKALELGGFRLVNSREEFVYWVRAYLFNPSLDRGGRRRLVEKEVQYTDGKSHDRISRAVLNMLKK